jgi:hypothetical protein
MLNQYAWWKYVIIGLVTLFGLLYALPNLFGEDPAVQISASRATVKVDQTLYARVLEQLESVQIPVQGLEFNTGQDRLLVRFSDTEMQLSISTEFLGLDGAGSAKRFASIAQWQEATAQQLADNAKALMSERENQARRSDGAADMAGADSAAARPKKLSFNDQRDLAGMEQAILLAEARVQTLHSQADDPALMTDHVRAARVYHDLADAQNTVQKLYDRWQELETIQRIAAAGRSTAR